MKMMGQEKWAVILIFLCLSTLYFLDKISRTSAGIICSVAIVGTHIQSLKKTKGLFGERNRYDDEQDLLQEENVDDMKTNQSSDDRDRVSAVNLGEDRFPGSGLVNTGYTCFLNSVVQCLRFTPTLTEILVEAIQDPELSAKGQVPASLEKKRHILLSFIDLVSKLRTSDETVDPIVFMDACSECTTLVVNSGNEGSVRQEQEDAEEFLSFLLNAFHDVLATNMEINRSPTDDEYQQNLRGDCLLKLRQSKLNANTYVEPVKILSNLAWGDAQRNSRSIVSKIFSGQIVRGSICQVCKTLSCSHEEIRMLQLELPIKEHVGKQPIRLEECLTKFIKAETLTGDEKRLCPGNCYERTNWQTQLLLQKLPPCLVIQLKRFEYSGWSSSGSKIKAHVEFPFINFDTTPYNFFRHRASGYLYDLFAVCAHFGTSITTGHYVAYVKQLFPSGTSNQRGDKAWCEFSDEQVTLMTEDEVKEATLGTSYILFYFAQPQEDAEV